MDPYVRRDTARAITARANQKPWYVTAAFVVFEAICDIFTSIADVLGDLWEWVLDWWGGLLALLAIGAVVGGFTWFMVSDYSGVNHYNADFKRFCTTVFHGTPYIDDRNICIGKNGRMMMHESSNDGSGDSSHYNADFARYCATAGGQTKIADRDTCTRSHIVIMRES